MWIHLPLFFQQGCVSDLVGANFSLVSGTALRSGCCRYFVVDTRLSLSLARRVWLCFFPFHCGALVTSYTLTCHGIKGTG